MSRKFRAHRKKLQATAYERFGFEGAEFALVACEFGELRENLKKVVRAAPALPQYDNPIGGPWAMDAAINRGSYLFDFGDLTEKDGGFVDRIGETARS